MYMNIILNYIKWALRNPVNGLIPLLRDLKNRYTYFIYNKILRFNVVQKTFII